jgi:polar amino acid transport system substrate-binding protein
MKTIAKTSLRAAWLAVLLAFAGSAWSRPLQQVRNQGQLRVGIALASPWAFKGGDGQYRGFEVDVAKRLAADMKVKAVILPYEWNRLIPALESGEIDIIAAGMTITADRALHVNFSNPYASGGISLATNLQSTSNVGSLEDLDAARYRLAAVRGSVAENLARRILPAATLALFDSAQAAGKALVAGDVDAYLEDEPVPTFLALENPEKIDVPVADPLLVTQAGFAIAKGDVDFLAFLNAWITARTADTWLPTTHDYWFKSLRWRNGDESSDSR